MAISSPFKGVHERLGANFREYHGWSLPGDYGDKQQEAEALINGTCAVDLSSFGKINLKGTGCSGLIVILSGGKPIPDSGTWVWVKVSDNENSLMVRISNIDENFTIFTLPQDCDNVISIIQTLIDQNHIEDVKVTNVTQKTGMLGVYGPKAIEAVTKIIPFDLSNLQENGIMTMSFFMISVTIIRGSWIGTDGYELLCPAMACPMAAGPVEKYHKTQNITPAGMDCLIDAMNNSLRSMQQNV